MFLRGGSTELPAGASPANAPATAPVPAPAAQPQPPGTAATPVPAAAPTVAAAMPLPARGVIASSLATWSTRLVIAGYDGPLLRLRRSGDHAEQDVGHAADGALDTAAASAFTGQGSAYVVAWYDQSGHRHHLRQGERDHQPRLIIDGTLQRENSRPVIVFERPRFDHLTTPVGIPIGCLSARVKVVQHGNETQAIMGSRSDSGVDSDAYYPIVDRLGKGTCEWWLGLTQDYTILTAPITRGRLLLWHSSQGGGARPRLTLRLDGKEVAAGIAAHDALVPMGPTMVGGLYWARKPGDPFGGALGELIVLPPGSSDEVRATITRELMAWWKIP
jgi:hypothetical protein